MAHFADGPGEGPHIGIAQVTGEVLLNVPVVDGLSPEKDLPPFFLEDSVVATAVLR
jgi:hypothetical protein